MAGTLYIFESSCDAWRVAMGDALFTFGILCAGLEDLKQLRRTIFNEPPCVPWRVAMGAFWLVTISSTPLHCRKPWHGTSLPEPLMTSWHVAIGDAMLNVWALQMDNHLERTPL